MAGLLFSAPPCEGPITGRFEQADGFPHPHRGVDIGCEAGTPIRWTGIEAGKVVDFTNDGSFGLGVCIDLPGTPFFSLTAHMSRVDVSAGDTVEPGELLGLSGFTGMVDPPGPQGAHCHWQVCRSRGFPTDISQSTDPLEMIEGVPSGIRAALATGPNAQDLLHAIATALTGFAERDRQLERLRAWNFFPAEDAEHPSEPRGNSLLDGFSDAQARLGAIEARDN